MAHVGNVHTPLLNMHQTIVLTLQFVTLTYRRCCLQRETPTAQLLHLLMNYLVTALEAENSLNWVVYQC